MTVKTRLFKSNKTQAMRLPKAVAFPDDVQEVEVFVVGSSRVVCPVGHRWDYFFQGIPRVSDDFMTERDQGELPPPPNFDD